MIKKLKMANISIEDAAEGVIDVEPEEL